VALLGDGTTLLVGAWQDDSNAGGVWVFTPNNGVWTQQSLKLGTGGGSQQGWSVALSADGNTAIVGGPSNDWVLGVRTVGAAWVFRRVGGVWSQWGQKLVGGGGGSSVQQQGRSVAISGDGGTVVLGAPYDNYSAVDVTSIGAAWIFGRPKLYEVFPDHDTVDGGTGALIFGRNIDNVVSVTFAGAPATDVFEVTIGVLFATTPPHAATCANVVVTTTSGSDRLCGAYTYEAQATTTTLTSSVNPSALGQNVTFTARVQADSGTSASG